jgi:hypothetical protein
LSNPEKKTSGPTSGLGVNRKQLRE